MGTLIDRATPSQRMIYRAVRGAALNAAHAHPSWGITKTAAQSIAKRATGTLTAGWPDVLAARDAVSSERGAAVLGRLPRSVPGLQAGRGASGLSRRPLRRLWRDLARQVGPAKWSGQHERAAALIDVLRMIDALEKGRAA